MRGLTTARLVREFLEALGRRSRKRANVYLVGGATAVWEGWRDTTLDIDLKLVPDHDELYRAIHDLKDELGINVELASPDLFIPVPVDWPERSPHVGTFGPLDVRHFDLAAQALAKIERGHDRDIDDVHKMLDRGLIFGGTLRAAFEEIEPHLYRYPALDAAAFRNAVDTFLAATEPES